MWDLPRYKPPPIPSFQSFLIRHEAFLLKNVNIFRPRARICRLLVRLRALVCVGLPVRSRAATANEMSLRIYRESERLGPRSRIQLTKSSSFELQGGSLMDFCLGLLFVQFLATRQGSRRTLISARQGRPAEISCAGRYRYRQDDFSSCEIRKRQGKSLAVASQSVAGADPSTEAEA